MERLICELRFEAWPNLASLLPLLDAITPFDMPDNEITAQMTGQVRADNVNALLVKLLAQQPAPFALIIEDGQWLDSASWSVVQAVHRQVEQCLLVLTIRPLLNSVPSEFDRLRQAPDTMIIRLSPLSPEAVQTLVGQRLGVRRVPEPVQRVIWEKAQGHPLFSEELTFALRDRHLIVVEDHVCRVAANAGDLAQLDLPGTLQGVIISRLDQLPPREQLTLKVASVIGHIFPVRALETVYPIEADRAYLTTYLTRLEVLDLMLKDLSTLEVAYLFKNVMTQEVAYGLIPFAQRRQLHADTARWYETAHARRLEPYYPLLAFHWRLAEDATQTLNYLTLAGAEALQEGAYREVVEFLTQALALVEAEGETVHQPITPITQGNLRRARWERQIGQAFYGLGNLPQSPDPFPKCSGIVAPFYVGECGPFSGRHFETDGATSPASIMARFHHLVSAPATSDAAGGRCSGLGGGFGGGAGL